jgi:drug/metabolite transporter (DMT)-like permease
MAEDEGRTPVAIAATTAEESSAIGQPSTTTATTVVELATLSLHQPAVQAVTAAGVMPSPGGGGVAREPDGNHATAAVAILEASNETVQQIILQNQPEEQMISAVVNLEILSELVGASEEDFLAGLHHHCSADKVQPDRLPQNEAEPKEESTALADSFADSAGNTAAGEMTPLLPFPLRNDDEYQQTPVGAAAGAAHQQNMTEHVTLLADPFLECLAEVSIPIPAITIGDDNDLEGQDDDQHGNISVSETTTNAAATVGESAHPPQLFSHPHDHHHHAAFLLNIPTPNNTTGDMENHYVLALPDLQLVTDESIMTEASATLDMAITTPFLERALSYMPNVTIPRLPTDIQTVHLEATEHAVVPQDDDKTTAGVTTTTTAAAAAPVVHIDIIVDRKVPVIGYVILFTGFFALASVGAALDLQRGGVTPSMKTIWRQMATSLCLLPMAMKSIYYDGLPRLDLAHALMLPAVAVTYAFMTTSFVLSLQMTTLANAFVLSNMASLFLIVGRAVLGLPVLYMEGLGATAGFLGAAVCADDAARSLQSTTTPEGDIISSSTNGPYNNRPAMLGNFLALSASFATAGYLIAAKTLRQKMDLFVFMFIVMTLGWMFLILVLLLLQQQEVTFDLHPVHGIFGWMTWAPDRLPLTLYMALVCNCLGTTGYVAVMKYFSPLVPATVMLLEPLVGALLGTAAGTAPLPGLETWIGDLAVAGGTFLVIRAGARTTESIDATEALRTTRIPSHDAVAPSPFPRSRPIVHKDTSTSMRSVTSARSTGQRSQSKVFWGKLIT